MVSSIKCIPLLLCGPMDGAIIGTGNDPPPFFKKKYYYMYVYQF